MLNDSLDRLLASKAITQFQADWIVSLWPNVDEDAFAHPYLHAVREHTRLYIESAAQGDPRRATAGVAR